MADHSSASPTESVRQPAAMEKLVSLCAARGFIFASSEIYGGINGFWDYGPLGVELKNNLKALWWQRMVRERSDVVGVDTSIVAHPRTWEASGHVDSFSDPMVDCRACKKRFRADQLDDAGPCSSREGTSEHDFTEAKNFNLMLETQIGASADGAQTAYLRPETCQSLFTDFKRVREAARQKVPFGIAQIGKAFRNEITPRNFTFRSREFEQAEMEFFVPPAEDQQWYEYWCQVRFDWYVELGIDPSKLRMRVHDQAELAHYAKATSDIEYEYPFGWGELEGIACRTDFDLKRHSEASGVDLRYFDPETKEKYFPYVIEPAGGIDRMALTFLIDAYEEQQLEKDTRVVLHFHPEIAPITVGVFPLVKKEGMPEKAHEIESELRLSGMSTFYDEKAAIGRRYRRQDEAGTPFCVTIDGDTLTEEVVTVRFRDSMEQERVPVSELRTFLDQAIRSWVRPEKG